MAAHFGSRLRKGAATTALAAAAVAALSASQAPGVTADDHGRRTAGSAQDAPDPGGDSTASGDGHYYTDLPPLNSPTPAPGDAKGSAGTGSGDDSGIPATVLDAYKKAEAELRESKPGCNLPWELLAAIGHVESGQARGGRVDAQGTTYSKILGPVLNGSGFAHISDTDHGAYDGDKTYDRAVGPMQFIPSTWAWAGRDGNDDGVKDPNNVYDAALAAGHYLCRADRDLSVQANLDAAILSYNHSQDYLNTVLSWLEYYRKGTHSVPDGTGTLPRHRSDESTGPGRTPGSTPPSTTRPSTHHTPKPGHTGSGSGSGSHHGGKPSTEPTKPGTTPTSPAPTPTDTVDHLDDAGTGRLTARAGGTFDEKIVVRPETKAGTAVAKVRVRFVITGDTDATFTGGEKTATVVTGGTGTATAPALVAGEKTGTFTVRALVVGRTVAALEHTATVTERTADTLTRVGDAPLTCTPGGEFAEPIELKATYKGAAPGKVAATATLLTSAEDPAENDKGPYFKDPSDEADQPSGTSGKSDKKVRTLALTTDAKGVLKLPKLYADDTTGTFLLRVTTAGGATVTLELKVAEAAS
ncbi:MULTISPECIES: lytic transglycosylase domain-containing protein [Streptomyces]|uniref:lytic transglycosylase domain-containing protein n=1 Tax=Streptomyces TaxID=1883 RepID=UPI001F2856EE|nr:MULTISPECIES: lytic transglycosylase domain-containing protein [unclassified Streptomyces]MCF0090290.1 hypothetical protein [Streptomyces sp. MH192]MCF0102523.1 hypothetical protein [Streptomyces sp. MH191]